MTVGVTNQEAICFCFFCFRSSESDIASKSTALNIINIKFSRVDITVNERLLKKNKTITAKRKMAVSQTSQWLFYELSPFLNNSQWSYPSFPANGDSSMTYISKQDSGFLFIVILEDCRWVRFSLKHRRGCCHFPRRSCAVIPQKEERHHIFW